MGCGASAIAATPENFPYFCVTFHWVDIFRFVHATPRTISITRKCLQHHWMGKKPITEEASYFGAVDFEVHGRPFARGTGQSETVNSKVALCYFLQYLLADGWRIQVSSDMSRIMETTAWFFRRIQVDKTKKMPVVCTLSLSATDQLQLLKANDDLFDAMKAALKQEYEKPIQGEMELGDGNYMVKLKGNPWCSEEKEGMDARRFLLDTIRRFQDQGYFPYDTANLKGTADSIFFVRHPDANGWMKPVTYCMISLNQHDRLRLVDCPKTLQHVLREIILKYRGTSGIQRESDMWGSYEFKLKGNPWCAEAQDTVFSRLLIAKMLETMRGAGWAVSLAVDTSCKMNDKAVFIFKEAPPVNALHFCICPSEIDKIRFIAAPPNGRHGTHEIHIRSFFCFLLERLEKAGYVPVASCDVSARHIRTENGPDYPNDTHSWFLMKTG